MNRTGFRVGSLLLTILILSVATVMVLPGVALPWQAEESENAMNDAERTDAEGAAGNGDGHGLLDEEAAAGAKGNSAVEVGGDSEAYSRGADEHVYDAKPDLNVTFPDTTEKEQVWASPIFIFGTTDAGEAVEVRVNGEPVEELDPRTGNFLTMHDIPRGEDYQIEIEAQNPVGTTNKKTTVIYPDAWEAMDEEPLALHTHHLLPKEDQVLSAGNELTVVAQGSPGAEAYFRIGDGERFVEMEELPSHEGPYYDEGIYKGSYRVTSEDTPAEGTTEPKPVTVVLHRETGEGTEKVVEQSTPGSVAFMGSQPVKIVELKPHAEAATGGWLRRMTEGGNNFNLTGYTRTGTGYTASAVEYLSAGTWFEVTGRAGDYLRLRLSPDTTHLVHQNAVKEVSREALPAHIAGERGLEGALSQVRIEESQDKVTLRFDTGVRLPLKTHDGVQTLGFTLYGISTIVGEGLEVIGESDMVQNVEVADPAQFANDQAEIHMDLAAPMSSFDVRWEANDLVVEIHRQPEVDRSAPLADKTLVIDPGHGGHDEGAKGPGAIHEKDVALEVSKKLSNKLEAEGAEVIMVRETDVFVPLYERNAPAFDHNADLFVSIHANAHALGNDAVDTHGHMTLYNYAHNEALAEIMLDALEAEMELPRLWTWDRNIAVLRSPQVPSVLVELAYMKHPEDNYYLLNRAGQERFASAVKQGIVDYFLHMGTDADEKTPGDDDRDAGGTGN